MDNPDMIQPAESSRKSRRGLLAALGLGGTATALALSSRPAQAQESDTTEAPVADTVPATGEPPTTEPVPVAYAETTSETVVAATEVTAPPAAIQPEDRPHVAAAKVLELSAAAAYANAVARVAELGLDAPAATLLVAMHAHHVAYAEALSAAYGPGSPANANPALVAKLGGDVMASAPTNEVLKAAHDLERTAAATYLEMIGTVRSTVVASLLASIQVVEYRHAATLSVLLGTAAEANKLAIEDGQLALSAADITGAN